MLKSDYHVKVTAIPPFLSYPILSYPILSYPILSYPILSFPILSYPILSYPILSYPILSYPILSYPILSYPILSYPILSYPILSCPLLSSPILCHPPLSLSPPLDLTMTSRTFTTCRHLPHFHSSREWWYRINRILTRNLRTQVAILNGQTMDPNEECQDEWYGIG
jgi:hypothetical protein